MLPVSFTEAKMPRF